MIYGEPRMVYGLAAGLGEELEQIARDERAPSWIRNEAYLELQRRAFRRALEAQA